MNTQNINYKDLKQVGFPEGKVIAVIFKTIERKFKETEKEEVLEMLKKVLVAPKDFLDHKKLSEIANCLIGKVVKVKIAEIPLKISLKEIVETPLKESANDYKIYGAEIIEEGALKQMNIAMKLPITIAGALMPDAHQGYGLPIGGVLATKNAIIPFGVGVDIGCRMCLSIYDIT